VRVVFDTNTVISALLFDQGRLAWLRSHWQGDDVFALVSKATVDELIRALAYPKFKLDRHDIETLLAEYLPYTEPVEVTQNSTVPQCRDPGDQKFVDLAISGKADVLVTGDKALLEMSLLPCAVENAARYRARFDLAD